MCWLLQGAPGGLIFRDPAYIWITLTWSHVEQIRNWKHLVMLNGDL